MVQLLFIVLFLQYSVPVFAQSDDAGSEQQNSAPSEFTISYTNDQFDQVFEPWHSGFVQFSKESSAGTIITRLNMGRRFDRSGVQPQIDFYPSLFEGMYGYLNIGYSNSVIFPEWRYGGELFVSLPGAFEISGGVRQLHFTTSNVTIFTGSLSKYHGNFLFTLRPYVTPSDIGVSSSLSLLIRKYFSTADNYVTLRGGYGFLPEERSFQQSTENLFLPESSYLHVSLQHEIWDNILLMFSAGITRQELQFSQDDFYYRFSAESGLRFRF